MQLLRGQQCAGDVPTIASQTGTNGDHPALGIAWWELLDNTSECTDWGLMTYTHGSPCDANQAVVRTGTDAYGTPTGSEATNYGNFWGSAAAANMTQILSLAPQQQHSAVVTGPGQDR
jgi:hypothetical protein